MSYSTSFESAVNHAMLYEVGGFWKLTPDVMAGRITTDAQKKAVGYTNDPRDPGGETKFGVAKKSHAQLNIAGLTWVDAKDIYYNEYWVGASCDKMPGRVAVLHFDGAVNNGVSTAGKFLQRAINVQDDGKIGPVTIAALNKLDPIQVCNKICNIRAQYYKDLVAAKPSLQVYINGWLRRVEEMRAFVTNPSANF
jgi:lysozyme family protein